jgi:serine/threonine protein kinase
LVADPVKAMQKRGIEISEDAIDLVAKMVAVDPTERYTVQQIATHQWCAGACADETEVETNFKGLDAKHNQEIQSQ